MSDRGLCDEGGMPGQHRTPGVAEGGSLHQSMCSNLLDGEQHQEPQEEDEEDKEDELELAPSSGATRPTS